MAHFDASIHLIHKIDFPSLARSSRHHRQFLLLWRRTMKTTATMVTTWTLATVQIKLLITLLFQSTHLTSCGNLLLQLHVKRQHLSSPRNRLLQ